MIFSNFNSKSAATRWALAAAFSSCLTGCMLAPGINFQAPDVGATPAGVPADAQANASGGDRRDPPTPIDRDARVTGPQALDASTKSEEVARPATADAVSAPSVTASSNSDEAASIGPNAATPAGALTEITPDLIRRLRSEMTTDADASVKRLFAESSSYRIGAGDVLNIVVWDHPELALAPAGSMTTDATSTQPVSNGYNVSADGLIQLPYVGPFKVAGLTEYEIRDRVITRLSKYFNEPKVTVRVQNYRSGRVYIDGSVRLPGLQAVNDVPMTLPEAISRAGGFAQDADRSMVTVSRDGETTLVNLQQLVASGVNPNKIMLTSGDMVRVYSRDDAKVYVLGEVTRPTAQPLRNGRLSLNEALGEAGGISTISGNPNQIYVVRAKQGGASHIFHLNASTPSAYALAESFELKARDVVYVDPAPIVQWYRVINMILPSAQVVNVGNTLGR